MADFEIAPKLSHYWQVFTSRSNCCPVKAAYGSFTWWKSPARMCHGEAGPNRLACPCSRALNIRGPLSFRYGSDLSSGTAWPQASRLPDFKLKLLWWIRFHLESQLCREKIGKEDRFDSEEQTEWINGDLKEDHGQVWRKISFWRANLILANLSSWPSLTFIKALKICLPELVGDVVVKAARVLVVGVAVVVITVLGVESKEKSSFITLCDQMPPQISDSFPGHDKLQTAGGLFKV